MILIRSLFPITFFEHLPLKPRDEVGEDGKTVMDGVPDNSICYLHAVGLGGYDQHPDVKDKKWWEYTKEELMELGDAAKDFFIGNAVLPVAMGGNVFLNDAVPSRHESDAKIVCTEGHKQLRLILHKAKCTFRSMSPNCFGEPLQC